MTKRPSRPRAWNSTLPAPTKPMSRGSSSLSRTTRLKAAGPTKAKKRIRYRKYLASKEWKALRMARFAHDKFRCVMRTLVGPGVSRWERCPFEDASRTGAGLHCHHVSYARFGGSERIEDLRTLCADHHESAERMMRPWNVSRVSSRRERTT